MMTTPESAWVQPGMRVFDATGEELGIVQAVDPPVLLVGSERGPARAIPLAAVAEALPEERRVTLRVSRDKLDVMHDTTHASQPDLPLIAPETPMPETAETAASIEPTIASLMTPTPSVIDIDQPARVAHERLGGESRLSLIVVEGDRPVGIVWLRDLSSLPDDALDQPVWAIALPITPELTPTMPIHAAQAWLRTLGDQLSGVDALPVVDTEGRLVGAVPITAVAHAEIAATHATDLGIVNGMDVLGAHGKKLGTIDEVFRDSTSGKLTGFTVTHGLFGRKRKRLPADVIDHVEEHTVVLVIDAAEFDQLPDVES